MSADDGLRMQFLDYLPRYPIHRSEGTIDMVSLPRGMLFWRCEGLETRVDAMDRSHILLTLPGAMMAHAQNVAVEAEHSDKATVVPVVLTEPISLLDLSSPRTRETMNRIAPQIIASKSVGGTVSLSVGVAITSFTFGSPLFLALLLPLAGIAYSAALRGGVHVFPGNKLPSNMASDRIAMEYIDPNGTATTAAVQDSQENHHNPNGKRRRQKKEKRKKRHVFVDDDPRSNDPAKRYALNQALSRAVCGIPKSFVLHGYTSRKPIVYSRHWTTVPRLGRSPHTKAASPSTQEFPGTLEDFDEILLCPTSLKSDAAAFRTVSMSEFSPALRQAIHAKIGALERLRKSKSQVPNEFPKK